MLDESLARQYWNEVIGELQSAHHIEPEGARVCVSHYRKKLRDVDAEEVVYNSPVAQIAEAVFQISSEDEEIAKWTKIYA